MARTCPVCGTGTLKKGEKMVYCDGYKPKKDGNVWFNEGECDFHISYSNKAWGKALTPQDIIKLVEGGSLRNSKGDVMEIDIDNEDFFTKITFAPKKDDKEL